MGARGERLLTREFVLLGVVAMVFFGAFGAVGPVLPRFVRDELGAGDGAVGLVLGSMAVAAIGARPFLGRLGDQRGLRILLVLGGVLGALGFLANVAVDGVVTAILARLLAGAALAATMTGAVTLAVSLAPATRQGEASAYILVFFQLGQAMGPLAGEALLHATSFDVVWLAVAAAMGVSGAAAFLLPNRIAPRRPQGPGRRFVPGAVPPGIVIGIGILAFSGFSTFLVLYAEDLGMEQVAPLFVVSSVTMVAVRVGGARLPDRLGPVRGGTVALVLMGGALLLVAAWRSPVGLYLGVLIGSAGQALQFPSLVPVAIASGEEHERAATMATFSMFTDLGAALGPPLVGLVAALSAYRGGFVAAAGACAVGLVYLHVGLAPRLAAAAVQPGNVRT